MKNSSSMELKLKALRSFQAEHPNSCVGGSIGLMIQGIDLKRELISSDLDITTKELFINTMDSELSLSKRSDHSDFNYCFSKHHGNGLYTKVDVRINYEFSFKKISFEGHEYNATTVDEILFWKKKYAAKGSIKHINDLITIETGERPIEIAEDDDLPF